MGALHRGHVALIEEARRRADFVVVSVFVNPTQFGPNEDLGRYPRTLESDTAACRAAEASGLFVPAAEAMYPRGEQTRVTVNDITRPLEGAYRPGHFEGVATIVTKLFALVGPAVAVFGRKDYQQYRTIARMVEDLLFPIEIVGLPTVRDPDGLALSSRNTYLSAAERERALSIARGLSAAVAGFEAGERRAGALTALVRAEVERAGGSIDYIEAADARSFAVHGASATLEAPSVLAVAVRFGATRLIDNVVLGEDPSPLPANGA